MTVIMSAGSYQLTLGEALLVTSLRFCNREE
jgi:hypothetical protein